MIKLNIIRKEGPTKMKFIINDNYKSLRDYLSNFLLLSKKNVHNLNMKKSGIKINGNEVNLYKEVAKNDILEIDDLPIKSDYTPNNNKKITIEFEDEYLLIASKPFGMKTHPNEKEKESNTLVNYLAVNNDYIEPIHRLDTDTCGLVIFAKTPFVKAKLDHILEKKEITRYYTALVKNPIKPQKIITNIGRDMREKNKMAVTSSGKEAITNILSCKKINDELYKVTISLETGRTHQIRVHLQHKKNSIIGDKLYSKDSFIFKHMYLGALKLEFKHPVTNKHIVVDSSLNNLFNNIEL